MFVQLNGIIGTILSSKYIPTNSQSLSIFDYGSGQSQNVNQNILNVDINGNITSVSTTLNQNGFNIGNNNLYHIYGSFRLQSKNKAHHGN